MATSPAKLCVPTGFQDLLESFAREVLIHQPEDLEKFSADYFVGKIMSRPQSKMEKSTSAAQCEKDLKGLETCAAKLCEEENIEPTVTSSAKETACFNVESAQKIMKQTCCCEPSSVCSDCINSKIKCKKDSEQIVASSVTSVKASKKESEALTKDSVVTTKKESVVGSKSSVTKKKSSVVAASKKSSVVANASSKTIAASKKSSANSTQATANSTQAIASSNKSLLQTAIPENETTKEELTVSNADTELPIASDSPAEATEISTITEITEWTPERAAATESQSVETKESLVKDSPKASSDLDFTKPQSQDTVATEAEETTTPSADHKESPSDDKESSAADTDVNPVVKSQQETSPSAEEESVKEDTSTPDVVETEAATETPAIANEVAGEANNTVEVAKESATKKTSAAATEESKAFAETEGAIKPAAEPAEMVQEQTTKTPTDDVKQENEKEDTATTEGTAATENTSAPKTTVEQLTPEQTAESNRGPEATAEQPANN